MKNIFKKIEIQINEMKEGRKWNKLIKKKIKDGTLTKEDLSFGKTRSAHEIGLKYGAISYNIKLEDEFGIEAARNNKEKKMLRIKKFILKKQLKSTIHVYVTMLNELEIDPESVNMPQLKVIQTLVRDLMISLGLEELPYVNNKGKKYMKESIINYTVTI